MTDNPTAVIPLSPALASPVLVLSVTRPRPESWRGNVCLAAEVFVTVVVAAILTRYAAIPALQWLLGSVALTRDNAWAFSAVRCHRKKGGQVPSERAIQYVAARRHRMELEEQLRDQGKRLERVAILLNGPRLAFFHIHDEPRDRRISTGLDPNAAEVAGTYLPHDELQELLRAYSGAVKDEQRRAQLMPEGEREQITKLSPDAWKHVWLIE